MARNNGTVDAVDFSDFALINSYFFTLLDRAYISDYNNTKIIKLVEKFLFYETFLMECHSRDLPDFRVSRHDDRLLANLKN